jgi:membrane protease YdiL (CAAX protease family)
LYSLGKVLVSEFAQLKAWLVLAAATATPALGLWYLKVRGRRLLPEPAAREIPWSGGEILGIFVFVQVFWPGLLSGLLTETHFLTWLYGPDLDSARFSSARFSLWVTASAFPFQLATILLIPRHVSGTTLSQLGLSIRDFARNVTLGWVWWLVLSPFVITVHILSDWTYRSGFEIRPEEHPLAGLPAGDWWLVFLAATMVAPVCEELLFRGLLQPWLARRSWGGDLALLASFGVAILTRLDKLTEAWKEGGLWAACNQLHPVAFVLVMVPGYWLTSHLARRRRSNSRAARAVYGTALLFAVFHAAVWPTPVPLFVLALGLGYLAYRTQNLIAPMVLHSLFNGIACVALVLNQAAPGGTP